MKKTLQFLALVVIGFLIGKIASKKNKEIAARQSHIDPDFTENYEFLMKSVNPCRASQ